METNEVMEKIGLFELGLLNKAQQLVLFKHLIDTGNYPNGHFLKMAEMLVLTGQIKPNLN